MAFERIHPDPLVQRNLNEARGRDAHARALLSRILSRAAPWLRLAASSAPSDGAEGAAGHSHAQRKNAVGPRTPVQA